MARGWCRLSAPVRVAWPAVLAVIVVLGAACGGGTKAQPRTRSAGGVGQLRVVATTVLPTRMRDLTIASPVLGATVKVRLLLPVRYAARPGVRWPVLYLLHGCCDTYQSWTRSTDVEALTAHSDVLVVMPDGGKAGFYSDWLTGPRWETFHLAELRRILERDYRAGPVMAVAGASMGGLGALAYAARTAGSCRHGGQRDRIIARRGKRRPRQAVAHAENPGTVRLLRPGHARLAVLATGSASSLAAAPARTRRGLSRPSGDPVLRRPAGPR